MNQSALIRPDWTPATIALMVLGFVIFWPLGLAMLAYILFGERLRDFKRNANDRADGLFSSFRRSGRRYGPSFSTGNVAFDDWRKAEMDRIEDERRKLDEMRMSSIAICASYAVPRIRKSSTALCASALTAVRKLNIHQYDGRRKADLAA